MATQEVIFNEVDKKYEDKLKMVIERMARMSEERKKIEPEWITSEQQIDAPSYVDNDGKILYNSQVEQSLCEQYVGRVNNQIYFDMKPEEEADAAEIFASQKIVNYFLEKENFYRELSMWDYSKAIYGMGIFDTSLHLDIERKYRPKEGAEIESTDYSGGLDEDDLFEEYVQYNWSFTPKNVRPWDFYWDNRYFWQDKWELVEDCARVEYISEDALKQRWGSDKRYNIDGLKEAVWEDRSNWSSSHLYVIKLVHYYNKNTKDYIIVGNDKQLIRATKMKYKDGKLPFEVAQHYPENRCICGRGIPRKTRASKAYKNNMMQAALDKTWTSSFNNLVLGKNNALNDKYTVGGGMNIWEVNSIADFQQFQTDSNITGIQIAMQLMDDDIRENTGEDLKSSFDINPQEKLGQTEIKEENKAVRLKTVQIARDIALDNALTFTYHNIQQFAPVLLRKEEKISGDVSKVIRPVISLPGIKVTKKGNKQLMEEVTDYGQYGWYELNPKYRMIDGSVKIVTNSTSNKAGSVLEKNKFTELTNNLVQIANVYGPEAIKKLMPADSYIEMMNQAYGYDPDMKYTAKTKKDKVREANIKKIEALKEKLGGGLLPTIPTNETNNQQAMGGVQPQQAGAAQQGAPNEMIGAGEGKTGAVTGTSGGGMF